jgi:hypothetical protein
MHGLLTGMVHIVGRQEEAASWLDKQMAGAQLIGHTLIYVGEECGPWMDGIRRLGTVIGRVGHLGRRASQAKFISPASCHDDGK